MSAAWIAEAGLASALLMALVLLVRAPVRRAFGPGVAYALWALPGLRLVLPPLPAEWLSGWEGAATPVSYAGGAVVSVIVQPAPEAVPGALAAGAAAAEPMLSPGLVLGGAWALGAAAFFAWHAAAYLRLRRSLLAEHRLVDTVNRVRVIESPRAAGPLALGVWRRYAVLPADLGDRWDADERALALAHELAHHARGDLAANWAGLAVLSVHWFNPLAWRAFRAFRADQELACDARVLRGRGRAERAVYACAIVKAAHGFGPTPACHLHTVEDLKGRLRMLKLTPASGRRLAAGAASVAVLAAGGLALTASGTGAAAAVRAVRQVLPPAPPAPPPAPAADPAPAAAPAAPRAPRAPAPPLAASASAPSTSTKRRTVTVTTTRDGRTETRSWSGEGEMPADIRRALAAAPEFRDEQCPGDQGPTTERRTEGERSVIVLCRNRLDASARRGEAAARAGEEAARKGAEAARKSAEAARRGQELALRAMPATPLPPLPPTVLNGSFKRLALLSEPMYRLGALYSAQANLKAARRSVERAAMPDTARAQALAGIDQGLREIADNLRRKD